jgi:hypothetical protein
MRGELQVTAQSNPMRSSNGSSRSNDSLSYTSVEHLRKSNVFSEWSNLNKITVRDMTTVVRVDSAGGSFLQAGAADVMTWYRLGEANVGAANALQVSAYPTV